MRGSSPSGTATSHPIVICERSTTWALEREPEITLRPKTSVGTMQFPLPIANTLQMFQGLGMLLPELLLITAAVLWLRRRSA